MKKFQIPFYSFLLLSISSCSNDDDEGGSGNPPLEAETQMNVAYGENPQQVYDLYLPANRNSNDTEVIMLIHGGAWTEGDKNDMNGMVAYLQFQHPDKAIVNVNYVLADENHFAFPYQFEDIQTILQKLTNEKDELHIKPEFGLIGASAGAHIAMMVDSQFDNQNQVSFVADIVGPSDFNDSFYETNFPIQQLLNVLVDANAYPNGTDFLTELSPVTHVSINSTAPTCLFYGIDDPLVPEENGTTMQAKLNQFGIENDLRIYEGGHGDWSTADLTEAQQIIDQYIDNFLN